MTSLRDLWNTSEHFVPNNPDADKADFMELIADLESMEVPAGCNPAHEEYLKGAERARLLIAYLEDCQLISCEFAKKRKHEQDPPSETKQEHIGLSNPRESMASSPSPANESMASSPSSLNHVHLDFGDGDEYHGPVKPGTETPYGRGTMIWRDGHRYKGEFSHGEHPWPHGRGTLTLEEGDRYEGEFEDGLWSGKGTYMRADCTRYEGKWRGGGGESGWGKRHGRGTWWTSDGARCFVGDWFWDGALRGAMMEADGGVFHVVFDVNTTWSPSDLDGDAGMLLEIDNDWAAAVAAAKERTPAGRVVEGGPPAPGGCARAVRVELAGGGAYAGAMEGLSFVGDGVLTDAAGAAWRVTHADGNRTFAVGQELVAKEVRAAPRALARNGFEWLLDGRNSARRLRRLVETLTAGNVTAGARGAARNGSNSRNDSVTQ